MESPVDQIYAEAVAMVGGVVEEESVAYDELVILNADSFEHFAHGDDNGGA